MEKKKKKYVKPETVVIKVEPTKDLMTASGTCDCYQHRMFGGCEGCPGGGKEGHTCTCGCNH